MYAFYQVQIYSFFFFFFMSRSTGFSFKDSMTAWWGFWDLGRSGQVCPAVGSSCSHLSGFCPLLSVKVRRDLGGYQETG